MSAGWGRGFFLCGCKIIPNDMDDANGVFDEADIYSCAVHGARSYGWRSGPVKQLSDGRKVPVRTAEHMSRTLGL